MLAIIAFMHISRDHCLSAHTTVTVLFSYESSSTASLSQFLHIYPVIPQKQQLFGAIKSCYLKELAFGINFFSFTLCFCPFSMALLDRIGDELTGIRRERGDDM